MAMSFVIAAIVVAAAYTEGHKPVQGTITVTGLGETEFTSDLIVIQGEIEAENYDAAEAYRTLEQSREKMVAFLTYKGVDHVTIAGLPKDALPKYCEKNGLDIYDIFNDNMLLDVDVSLKNAVTYNDRPHEDIIEGVRCYEKSSVGIYPNTFTLKLQDYYLYLINNFLEVSKNYEKRIY